MSSPSKTSGQLHSAKGNVKEALGSTFGATNLHREGKQEHAAGEAEVHAAKTKGYAEGTADRIGGKKDQVVGAVTGDRTQQNAGDIRNTKGETKQDFNRKF